MMFRASFTRIRYNSSIMPRWRIMLADSLAPADRGYAEFREHLTCTQSCEHRTSV
jgi:hypothetical protein